MASTKVFQVIHPDGTISERSSTGRTYTHAVEVRRVTALDLAAARQDVAEREESLAVVERAYATGNRVTKARDWMKGRTWTDLYAVDPETGTEVFITGWRDQEAPTEEAIQEAISASRGRYASSVEAYRQRVARLEALPEFTYGVARWSMSLENATKALGAREVAYAGEQGHTLRVVEATLTDKKRLTKKK